VLRLNTELMEAMTKKMAAISASVNDVKGGIDLEHQHDKDGRVTVGKNGEAVVLQEATVGFDSEALNIGDQLTDDLMDIQSD
jgi:DNA primase large subunit